VIRNRQGEILATTSITTSSTLDSAQRLKELEPGLQSNLDFLLSHFEQPVIWPRNIAVYLAGKTRVYSVNNKIEAVARFKQANLLDCRISAYPQHPSSDQDLSDNNGNGYSRLRQPQPQLPPTFVFIDLDKSTFKTYRAYRMAVNKTRKNFKEILGANPTIQHTGNGVHFYQPVKLVYDKATLLEDIDIFSQFKDPTGIKKDLTTRLMRHIEALFTGNKQDPDHRPSINSCLVRVPHTFNSKCIDLRTGTCISNKDPEVKIIQRWDGQRAPINYVMQSFRTSLINDAIKEKLKAQHLVQQKQRTRHNNIFHNYHSNHSQHYYYYTYIEKLLQTPIQKYRKNGVSLLIVPYLVVVKKLASDKEVFTITRRWLDRCNQVKPLDRTHDYNYRIRSAIASSRRKQILPMGLERLKENNKELHHILVG
jgi:non-catalytic primase subunit PriX-like protein